MNLLLLFIKGLRSFMYCEFISAPVIILLINILVDETVPVWFSKQQRECFRGARFLSCKSVKELSFVGWVVGGGSCGSVRIIGGCGFCCRPLKQKIGCYLVPPFNELISRERWPSKKPKYAVGPVNPKTDIKAVNGSPVSWGIFTISDSGIIIFLYTS